MIPDALDPMENLDLALIWPCADCARAVEVSPEEFADTDTPVLCFDCYISRLTRDQGD